MPQKNIPFFFVSVYPMSLGRPSCWRVGLFKSLTGWLYSSSRCLYAGAQQILLGKRNKTVAVLSVALVSIVSVFVLVIFIPVAETVEHGHFCHFFG